MNYNEKFFKCHKIKTPSIDPITPKVHGQIQNTFNTTCLKAFDNISKYCETTEIQHNLINHANHIYPILSDMNIQSIYHSKVNNMVQSVASIYSTIHTQVEIMNICENIRTALQNIISNDYQIIVENVTQTLESFKPFTEFIKSMPLSICSLSAFSEAINITQASTYLSAIETSINKLHDIQLNSSYTTEQEYNECLDKQLEEIAYTNDQQPISIGKLISSTVSTFKNLSPGEKSVVIRNYLASLAIVVEMVLSLICKNGGFSPLNINTAINSHNNTINLYSSAKRININIFYNSNENIINQFSSDILTSPSAIGENTILPLSSNPNE